LDSFLSKQGERKGEEKRGFCLSSFVFDNNSAAAVDFPFSVLFHPSISCECCRLRRADHFDDRLLSSLRSILAFSLTANIQKRSSLAPLILSSTILPPPPSSSSSNSSIYLFGHLPSFLRSNQPFVFLSSSLLSYVVLIWARANVSASLPCSC